MSNIARVHISEVIATAGGVSKIARAVRRHHATVLGWTQVPPHHVREVSRLTNIPAHELRPDLYDPPAAPAAAPEAGAAK